MINKMLELDTMTKRELIKTALEIGILPTYLNDLKKSHIIHLIEEADK